MLKGKNSKCLLWVLIVGVLIISQVAFCQEKTTIRVCWYQPVAKTQLEVMNEWAEQHPEVNLEISELPYTGYTEKMVSGFLTSQAPYDLIMQNDDWGQMWAPYLEGLEDMYDFSQIPEDLWGPPFAYQGHITSLPFVATGNVLYYRTDLIPKPPETWKDFQVLCKALKDDGKVKWGFAAGMKYPDDWTSLLWSMWSNNCDHLYPPHERDNSVLASYGWTSMATDERTLELINFWRENIFELEICPPDMPGFSRTAGDAVFMAGNSAMVVADTMLYGNFTDPEQCKVADRIGIAPLPYGPHGKTTMSFIGPLGWSIPKNIPTENKKILAEMLPFLVSVDAQTRIWEKTGGTPVTYEARKLISEKDPLFNKIAEANFEAPFLSPCTYFFPEWSEVKAAWSDAVIRAIIGPEDKILETMQQLEKTIFEIMKR